MFPWSEPYLQSDGAVSAATAITRCALAGHVGAGTHADGVACPVARGGSCAAGLSAIALVRSADRSGPFGPYRAQIVFTAAEAVPALTDQAAESVATGWSGSPAITDSREGAPIRGTLLGWERVG